jgi:hypothetical protein
LSYIDVVTAYPARPHGTRQLVRFGIVAALMFAIDGVIARSPIIDVRPDLVGGAVAFDLTIGIVFAYWLLLVRPGRANAQSMFAVFGISTVAATLVLGSEHLDGVRLVRYFGLPFELGVVGFIAAKVARTARRHAASGVELDIPERIRLALGGSSMQSRVADIVAMETAIFYYAIASWRRQAFVPRGAQGFSYHAKNGYLGILYTVVRMALVEAIALDFVIRVKSPTAANIFLALDLFTALWVLGLARGVKLRPILVTRDEIHVRNGLQWRLDIARSNIAHVEFGKVRVLPKRAPEHLRAAPGRPNVLIELRAPQRAYGPYGFTRMVRHVSLALDDVASFEQAISVS